jgi:hypothetical protein
MVRYTDEQMDKLNGILLQIIVIMNLDFFFFLIHLYDIDLYCKAIEEFMFVSGLLPVL